MPLRFFPALIFFLLMPFSAHATERVLDIRNIQTLDVLLFELQPTSNLTISAHNGSVSLHTEQRNFRQSDDAPAFAISVQQGAIGIRHPDFRGTSSTLTLIADEGAMIRIYHPEAGIRYYKGRITIRVASNRRTFQLINNVALEDYIASVVGGEMNFPEMEALKAQAVIARTYALWSLAHNSHREYQLTDHTMNQVYKGMLISRPDYLEAALATRGEVLTWSNRLILAAYSSTCGGQTSDNESIWTGGRPLPYLRSVSDGSACAASPHFRWEYQVESKKLYEVMARHSRQRVTGLAKGEPDRHGLIPNMILLTPGGPQEIRANTFRLLVNQEIARNSIRSTRFEMIRNGNYYIFQGKGLGHGIGLCQWGARGLAQSGWNYEDILKLYYTGTEIVDFTSLNVDFLHLAQ